MRRTGITLALLATTSCTRLSSFVCAESTDCMDGSFAGTCQTNGYCSFDDDDCPSGQRYGDLAGDDLAGECVDGEGTTGTSATTSEEGPVTLDGVSLEQGSLEASSLDDTTTTTTDAESTSTGNDVNEASADTNSMTEPDSDPTMAESSTGSSGCVGMDGGGECNACTYDLCCAEIIACSMDRSCTCYIQCIGEATMVDQCAELCGGSTSYDTLNMCAIVNCGAQCSGAG